ncbi:MAG TPA: crotonase/enoyl-CoA hydratase family protein [Acidimicrobiales bacterium]
MTFSSEVLSIEVAGNVGTLWLDRPQARNAMGRAFFDDLPRAMTALAGDPEVRAVVVAAKGPAFTVGLDLKEMGSQFAGGATGGGDDRRPPSHAKVSMGIFGSVGPWQDAISSLERCSKPVIAAVHGWVIGGGIDLITSADIRLAAADAKFSVRETKVGIVADLGTLQRLPRVIAAGHVAELAYTGKDIDAERAREIGLVNDVHPDAEAVVKAAQEMASEIAANSPLVVQGTKHVLRAGRDMTVQEGLEYVGLWNSAFLQSNDLVEAMMAFMEKRDAHFGGD